ncbi:acyl-CoA N-acyltransferase [Xylariaceae sp. AK1471]|nr:acyl-CoA N-acyltransferase [Xylariaceae sp. AK1471]
MRLKSVVAIFLTCVSFHKNLEYPNASMAPQKRKHPHDAGLERPIPQAPARRPTRQHPDASTEAEHQLRSGRVRANTIEKSSGVEVERPVSRARKGDAPKAVTADPAVATRQTRTTRRRVTAEPEETTVAFSASKENVRPPTPPAEGRRGVISLPKQSRHRAHAHAHTDSLPQPKPRQSSPSQSRAFVPRTSQQKTRPIPAATGSGPAPIAGAVTITPKRTPPIKSKTPKPPGTPRSDRNIDKIIFGNTCFKAWYPSYYGKEILGDVSANVGGGNAKIGGGKRDSPMLDRLYICPCCFKYSKELIPWWKHVQYCEKKAFVPGTKVYTHPRRSKAVSIPQINSTLTSPAGANKWKGKNKGDDGSQMVDGDIMNEGEWSVWEVDGEKEGLFCQNLSLFAKLFLDNKSVFFDVSGFNYFLLVYTPPLSEIHPVSPAQADSAPEPLVEPENPRPVSSNPHVSASTSLPPCPRPQIVGFFSKEKMSWDNNNLACILIFPPWQRKGLGALLMGVSYEISRREGILGGPEKPISELGRKGYKRFWAGEIIRWILALELPASSTGSAHPARHARREKDKVKEQDGLIVDAEQCSRDTWIVPEDCLAVLRDMGVIEEAGHGPPRGERDGESDGNADAHRQGKEKEEKEPKTTLVPWVRIDRAAVRAWARETKIDLTLTCDPDGFVEGYAIKQVEDELEEG